MSECQYMLEIHNRIQVLSPLCIYTFLYHCPTCWSGEWSLLHAEKADLFSNFFVVLGKKILLEGIQGTRDRVIPSLCRSGYIFWLGRMWLVYDSLLLLWSLMPPMKWIISPIMIQPYVLTQGNGAYEVMDPFMKSLLFCTVYAHLWWKSRSNIVWALCSLHQELEIFFGWSKRVLWGPGRAACDLRASIWMWALYHLPFSNSYSWVLHAITDLKVNNAISN